MIDFVVHGKHGWSVYHKSGFHRYYGEKSLPKTAEKWILEKDTIAHDIGEERVCYDKIYKDGKTMCEVCKHFYECDNMGFFEECQPNFEYFEERE